MTNPLWLQDHRNFSLRYRDRLYAVQGDRQLSETHSTRFPEPAYVCTFTRSRRGWRVRSQALTRNHLYGAHKYSKANNR